MLFLNIGTNKLYRADAKPGASFRVAVPFLAMQHSDSRAPLLAMWHVTNKLYRADAKPGASFRNRVPLFLQVRCNFYVKMQAFLPFFYFFSF
jgi:hypothetical protein